LVGWLVGWLVGRQSLLSNSFVSNMQYKCLHCSLAVATVDLHLSITSDTKDKLTVIPVLN